MRAFFTLVVMAAVLAGVGYVRGWYTFTSTNNPDHTTQINIKVNNVKWSKDKEAFIAKAKVAVAKLSKQLDELKDQAQQTPVENQGEIKQEIDTLHRQHQDAQDHLQQLENATQDNWNSVETKAQGVIDNLDQNMKKATTRFRRSYTTP